MEETETYATREAHKAIDGARRCEFAIGGKHSEACRAAAGAIDDAIKMCARIARDHQYDVDTMHWGQACRRVESSILDMAVIKTKT